MKRYVIIIAVLALLLLCGCGTGRVQASFRYYENGGLKTTVDVPSGYVLDVYDAGETEDGYDITFHLRRADHAD